MPDGNLFEVIIEMKKSDMIENIVGCVSSVLDKLQGNILVH